MNTDTPDDPRFKYVVLAGGPRANWVERVPAEAADVTMPYFAGYTATGVKFSTTVYRERSEGSLIFDHQGSP